MPATVNPKIGKPLYELSIKWAPRGKEKELMRDVMDIASLFAKEVFNNLSEEPKINHKSSRRGRAAK